VLTESVARWLLVLHTALGVAAVATTTHLVLWLRGYLRGKHDRYRPVRRFAAIALALQIGTFAAGNLMYPTYKVEVRAAYLENAGALVGARAAHEHELAKLAAREHAPPPAAAPSGDLTRRATATARWFDVKEHWVALGMLGSAALLLILAFWDPRRDGTALAPIVLGLATIVCGTTWFAAIVGVLTSAWRAV
jgi:hypothetical protein